MLKAVVQVGVIGWAFDQCDDGLNDGSIPIEVYLIWNYKKCKYQKNRYVFRLLINFFLLFPNKENWSKIIVHFLFLEIYKIFTKFFTLGFTKMIQKKF